jgi:hypothetical protein
MRMSARELIVGMLLCPVAGVAGAAPLNVVTVSAPEINCIYETDCTVTVTDTVAAITLPSMTGAGRLQSRTFAGQAGAPAAGKTGYEYRLDMTQATAIGDVACVTGLEVSFGPINKLQYNKVGPVDDVFVITKGGLGSIGLASAEQDRGGVITFTFSQPVCAADTSGPGKTTYFFGLTSAHTPKGIVAKVEVPAFDPVDIKARAPDH